MDPVLTHRQISLTFDKIYYYELQLHIEPIERSPEPQLGIQGPTVKKEKCDFITLDFVLKMCFKIH